MAYLNLVRAVREAAGLSKPELAEVVGKKPSTIAAWELEPDSKEARILADLAAKRGLHRVAHDLLVLAGDAEEEEYSSVALEELSGDEQQLAEWVIAKYRNPANELERAVVQLMWALKNTGESLEAGNLTQAFQSLSPDNQILLERFIEKPEAMMIIAAVVGGGNPPNAFASSEAKDQKSTGRNAATISRS